MGICQSQLSGLPKMSFLLNFNCIDLSLKKRMADAWREGVEMTTNKVSKGPLEGLTGSSQNLGEIATMATLPA